MNKFLKMNSSVAFTVTTGIFTFVPETIFEKYRVFCVIPCAYNALVNRLLTLIVVFLLSVIFSSLWYRFRKSVTVKGPNYSIKIEYGDLFEMQECKKVIPFDECFTTHIGDLPSDINPKSICGQYLKCNPIDDMQALINRAQLHPSEGKSAFQEQVRYKSGSIVPHEKFLLMSFAKLDEVGLGGFSSYDEYLDCLSLLWKELDKHYGQMDVCIPILGSGVTRLWDSNLTQQKLLDIIIGSYRLSAHKLKSPCKLHIVCREQEGFSLNKIS